MISEVLRRGKRKRGLAGCGEGPSFDQITVLTLCIWRRQAWANSVDPDQLLQNHVAFDQCLHCL